MTNYFNLHATDGSPTGEFVDPVAALDNNYTAIDAGLAGFQHFNTSTAVVNLSNPEVGQEVVSTFDSTSSYIINGAFVGPGGGMWVADNTNTWRKAQQVETWGPWIPIKTTLTVSGLFFATISYRVSNFGRTELDGYMGGYPIVKNNWTAFHDPAVAAPADRILYAGTGPVIVGGAGATYIGEGSVEYLSMDNGQAIMWALDFTTISSVNYLHLRFAYTDQNNISNPTIYMNNIVYDNGYAGL
jgi:hypothetical protein